jgi:hypothetical protein
MAVHLKPCHGCPVPRLTDDRQCADKRAEMRAKVSGLGLSSATFKCPILAEHFRIGRRISINTPVLKYAGFHEDDWRVSHVEVRATVLSFDGRNFQCVVDLEDMEKAQSEDHKGSDKEAKDYIYRKPMRASRIVRFIDEPDRSLCEGGNVALDSGKCDRQVCGSCYPVDLGWLP